MENLTGKKFARLTVVNDPQQGPFVDCLCDCGKLTTVRRYGLLNGNTKSCGCYSVEVHSTQQGKSSSRLYSIWKGMKKRCHLPTDHAFHNYGARGIYVCDEWRDNFLLFEEWAISHGYCEGLSIDRIDNDGPYSPDNCRWATSKEQGNNTRKCHYVTRNGETHSISEWSEITGIGRKTIERRLKVGWDIEDALTLPVGVRTRWRDDSKRNKEETSDAK